MAQSGQAEELGSSGDQVSMSQRQQQHRAVQQAVRQVDGPRSSLLWSSTTYTGKRRKGRVRGSGIHLRPAVTSQDQRRGTAVALAMQPVSLALAKDAQRKAASLITQEDNLASPGNEY